MPPSLARCGPVASTCQARSNSSSCSGILSSLQHQRVPRVKARAFSGDRDRSASIGSFTVDLHLKPRNVAKPPESPPVVASPIYRRMRIDAESGSESDGEELALHVDMQVVEPFEGNAIEWALKKVDQSLDEMEENPSELQKGVYKVSRGPVGQATARGIDIAASATVKVTKEAVKAAIPVGQWVLKEGSKAAVGFFVAAMAKANEQKKKKKKKT